jgi:glycosyltransferase involved in cell wall biosynthesis
MTTPSPIVIPEQAAPSARTARTLLVVVATISDGATGGAELQARYLAEAWAGRGHRVHVVPIQMKRGKGSEGSDGRQDPTIANAKARKRENAKGRAVKPTVERWGDLNVHFLRHDWFTPAGMSEFRGILRSVQPELCYVRVLKPVWMLARACRSEGVPWVYNAYFLPHCERSWRPPATLSPRVLSVYVRKSLPDEFSKCFLRCAAAVVAQTEEQRVALAANYGLHATVVPNGHPLPEEGSFPKVRPPLVLWVGKDWKRPAAFVEIAERLRDLDARFVMVGSLPPELAAEIDARRWDNVTRVGTVSPAEVNRLLRGAVAVVSTSPAEGYPNTFIQAWMREAAVVSLSIDPDGVLSRAGMGHCSGTVDGAASDLRALLTDEARRRKLVRYAREEALRRHSLPRVAAAYEDVFEGVLERSTGNNRRGRPT